MSRRSAILPSNGMEIQRRETPRDFFAALHAEFDFGLDAAGDPELHQCTPYYGPGSPWREDALSPEPWESATGAAFMNPPWGRYTSAFVSRARAEAWASGLTVAVLVPASSDTQWWQANFTECEVRFVRGRLKLLAPGQAHVRSQLPLPLCVGVMRPSDRRRRKHERWAAMRPAR